MSPRSRRKSWMPAVLLLLWPAPIGCHTAPPTVVVPARAPVDATPGVLRASGRSFVDPLGRVVLLRGVNLSSSSKVPPFSPIDDPRELDRLTALGMNVVRLLFIWEAYEPSPGCYDEAYLARLVAISREAWARGLYVVVDIHQDGFSRWVSRGCGAGFPSWAVSPRATATAPDNSCDCKDWVAALITDPNFHKSFADFYADTFGVRTRYLLMLDRVATAFAANPGVIGYDPLNEPWGDPDREIMPLYRDAAAAVRARHPTAIFFLEGHGVTSDGKRSRLPRPPFDNVAYAPHYYRALAVIQEAWRGSTRPIDRAFENMEAKAEEWGSPVFLGEFGLKAGARRAGDYVGYLYDRLDADFFSGAQWNYTPRWNDRDKDGWNGEDYNILDPSGTPRPNYRVRPFPQKVAGRPIGFRFDESAVPGGASLWLAWEHRPDQGETEVFVPSALFPPDSTLSIEPADATWKRDDARQLLLITAPRAVTVRLILAAPARAAGLD